MNKTIRRRTEITIETLEIRTIRTRTSDEAAKADPDVDANSESSVVFFNDTPSVSGPIQPNPIKVYLATS